MSDSMSLKKGIASPTMNEIVQPPKTMAIQVAHPSTVCSCRCREPSRKIWKKMAREVTREYRILWRARCERVGGRHVSHLGGDENHT